MSGLPEIRMLQRGWLSSNSVLLFDGHEATLVDSGYVTHAAQMLEMLAAALEGRRLARLINTHGHSDHIGGNAVVHAVHECRIVVPAGLKPAIDFWDENALLLKPTGQQADRFRADDTIEAGETVAFGGRYWQVLAAPGHDPHALVFFSEEDGILITGDALWENGFGIVFSELIDENGLGFAAVRQTLDTLSALTVNAVIPGHGEPFTDYQGALARAYSRLDAFEADPERHARHALKALLVFALFEHQPMTLNGVIGHVRETRLFAQTNDRYFRTSAESLAMRLVDELIKSGALKVVDGQLMPRDG